MKKKLTPEERRAAVSAGQKARLARQRAEREAKAAAIAPSSLTEDDIASIQDMLDKDRSYYSIGLSLDCSEDDVWKFCNKHRLVPARKATPVTAQARRDSENADDDDDDKPLRVKASGVPPKWDFSKDNVAFKA